MWRLATNTSLNVKTDRAMVVNSGKRLLPGIRVPASLFMLIAVAMSTEILCGRSMEQAINEMVTDPGSSRS
jgi:hypothetical protein